MCISSLKRRQNDRKGEGFEEKLEKKSIKKQFFCAVGLKLSDFVAIEK